MPTSPLNPMKKSETETTQDTLLSGPRLFHWPIVERLVKASAVVIAVIILLNINPISPPDPRALSAGVVILVALTLLGVPVIPAAAAGIAIWLAAQNLL